ncbi:MAG: hypothetical protein WCF95_01750 [bacterium]
MEYIFYIFAFLIFLILEFGQKSSKLSLIVLFILPFSYVSATINKSLGPLRCNDGWQSYSIGYQGACSHHGGVESRSLEVGYFLLSLLSAIFVILIYLMLKEFIIKHQKNKSSINEILQDFFMSMIGILKFVFEMLKGIASFLPVIFIVLISPFIILVGFIRELILEKIK